MTVSGRFVGYVFVVVLYSEVRAEPRCISSERGWCEAGERKSEVRFRPTKETTIPTTTIATLTHHRYDNKNRSFFLWAMRLKPPKMDPPKIFREGQSALLDANVEKYCGYTPVHAGFSYLFFNINEETNTTEIPPVTGGGTASAFDVPGKQNPWKRRLVFDVFYFCCRKVEDFFCSDFLKARDNREVGSLLLAAYHAPPPISAHTPMHCYRTNGVVEESFGTPCAFLVSSTFDTNLYSGPLLFDRLHFSTDEPFMISMLLRLTGALVNFDPGPYELKKWSKDKGDCVEYFDSKEYFLGCVCFYAEQRSCSLEFVIGATKEQILRKQYFYRQYPIFRAPQFINCPLLEPNTSLGTLWGLRSFMQSAPSDEKRSVCLEAFNCPVQHLCYHGTFVKNYESPQLTTMGKAIYHQADSLEKVDLSNSCVSRYRFVFNDSEAREVISIQTTYNNSKEDHCGGRVGCYVTEPSCPNELLKQKGRPSATVECCCDRRHFCNKAEGEREADELQKSKGQCVSYGAFLNKLNVNQHCVRYFDFDRLNEIFFDIASVTVKRRHLITNRHWIEGKGGCYALEVRSDRNLFAACAVSVTANTSTSDGVNTTSVVQQLPQLIFTCSCNFTAKKRCDRQFDGKYVKAASADVKAPRCEQYTDNNAKNALLAFDNGTRANVTTVPTLHAPLCVVYIEVNAKKNALAIQLRRVENAELEVLFANGLYRTEFNNDGPSSRVTFYCRTNYTEPCNSIEAVRTHFLPYFLMRYLNSNPNKDPRRMLQDVYYLYQNDSAATAVSSHTKAVGLRASGMGFNNWIAKACMKMGERAAAKSSMLRECFVLDDGTSTLSHRGLICCEATQMTIDQEFDLSRPHYHLFHSET